MRTAHPCHDLVAALIVKSRKDAVTRSPVRGVPGASRSSMTTPIQGPSPSPRTRPPLPRYALDIKLGQAGARRFVAHIRVSASWLGVGRGNHHRGLVKRHVAGIRVATARSVTGARYSLELREPCGYQAHGDPRYYDCCPDRHSEGFRHFAVAVVMSTIAAGLSELGLS